MDEVFLSWLHLTNQPISNQVIEHFTDGSSFSQDSTHFASYAVVTLDSVIEAHLLLFWTSVQKAELVTLMWRLQLTAGVQVNIYTLIAKKPSQPFTLRSIGYLGNLARPSQVFSTDEPLLFEACAAMAQGGCGGTGCGCGV
jgi:hypothetical protein